MIYTLVTEASTEAIFLQHVPYIWYPIQFQKNQKEINISVKFGSEINAMTLVYIKKLGFVIWKIDIDDQKIDDSALMTYYMAIVRFLLKDKLRRDWFFEKIFLLANISMKIVLKMPFFTFVNADIRLIIKKLVWRNYIVVEALSTTKKVEFINKNKLSALILDKNKETFVIYITTLLIAPKMLICLSLIAQLLLFLASKALA